MTRDVNTIIGHTTNAAKTERPGSPKVIQQTAATRHQAGGGGGDFELETAVVVRDIKYDDPDRVYPADCTWGTPDDPWLLEGQDYYIVREPDDSTADHDSGATYSTDDFCMFEVLADSVTDEAFAEVGYGYTLKYQANTDIDTPEAFDESKWDLVDSYGDGQWKIDIPLGQETSQDMRDYLPWFALDQTLPIITIELGETNEYLFWQTLIPIGDPDSRSLSWNAEDNRAMAVFR